MVRKGILVVVVAALVSAVPLSEARTESMPGQWAVGFRVGPAFLLEEAAVATATTKTLQGETGPLLNLVAAYMINDFLALGFDLEWEQHTIKGEGTTWGKTSTASILPRGELHLGSGTPFSPYFIFGVGYNFNFFSEDSGLSSTVGVNRQVDLDDSFALMTGIGADMFFMSDRFAMNLEVKVKHNRAHMKVMSGTVQEGLFDFKGHSLSILFGFRYHFPSSPHF